MDSETPEVLDHSILGELRQSRRKIGAGADPLDMTVPGYDDRLVIRYQWRPMERLAATSVSLSKIDSPIQQRVAAAADALGECCAEVMVRVDGELQPLSTNGEPVTFSDGERLAYALGFEQTKSRRECVREVFSNDYALIDQAFKLMSWLEDTSRKVSEEQLGE